MAKSDIADAFRIKPIHPTDYHLTGFQWNNKFYYDKCLPQGCSSSCKFFESSTDALVWIMKTKFGVKHIVKVI